MGNLTPGNAGMNGSGDDGAETVPFSREADPDVTKPSGAPPPCGPLKSDGVETLAPGALIAGRFEVVRTIGQGGMGVVYECRDRQLGRRVAVKRLLPSLAGEEWSVPRFVAEAKAVAAINHPNVMAIHDLIEDAAGLFIVMEYVEGEALQERFRREGKLPVEECTRIMLRVGLALDAAHRAGIIHRDIKPGNIMLGAGGAVKLGDFGLARFFGDDDLTRTGTAMGTWVYASPEQLADAKHVDHRTDLYSLGATLYEALTGEIPRHIDERPVPSPFVPVLRMCLAKDPNDRYRSAQEFVAALTEAFKAHQSADAAVAPPAPEAAVGTVAKATANASANAAESGAPEMSRPDGQVGAAGVAPSAPSASPLSKGRRGRVLWRGRGALWSQPLPVAMGLGLLVATLLFWGDIDSYVYALSVRIPRQYVDGSGYEKTLIGVGVAYLRELPWNWIGLGAGLLLALAPPAERLASKFRLSSGRLTAREGILLKRESSFPIDEIREVRVIQGPLGMALNYGDVSVTNRMGDVLLLRGVTSPSRARAKIAGATQPDAGPEESW